MSINIHIPTPLRRFTSETAEVPVEAQTVGAALGALTERFPELKPHLYAENGGLRSFVNVFKNDDNVRDLEAAETPLAEGDVLAIIPSIAGGLR